MLELEDWRVWGNMNCFIFLRELCESGKHESPPAIVGQAIFPKGDNTKYIGGLDEWLISTVY